MLNLYVSVCLCCSMLIYYLQAIARSLKFTNNQLRLQLQTVSFIWLSYTKINCKSAHDSQWYGGNYNRDMKADRNGISLHLFSYGISWHKKLQSEAKTKKVPRSVLTVATCQKFVPRGSTGTHKKQNKNGNPAFCAICPCLKSIESW